MSLNSQRQRELTNPLRESTTAYGRDLVLDYGLHYRLNVLRSDHLDVVAVSLVGYGVASGE